MKVLLLVIGEQRVLLDTLYDAVQRNVAHCDVVKLTSGEQKHLAPVLRKYHYQNYDRVVLFTRLKRQVSQFFLLRCIPNLIIWEHDACQNYMQESPYQGQYATFYKRLPWLRVISSGYGVTQRLVAEGIDAVFVSKGYDEQSLRNRHMPRDIVLGFLGSTKSTTYRSRKRILDELAQRTDLLVARTESGEDYVATLNRIRVFVSADVGMGEYMIKNFEAMACGCVLLAWSQGAEEDGVLGLKDGENALLYRSVDEALEKIELLNAQPMLAEHIAAAGQRLAEQHFTFARVGYDLARAIELPMREWQPLSRWQRIWAKLRYGI